MNWEELKHQLDTDIENGYDPLYEQTQSGQYLQDLCIKVEDELGIWGEPSIQAGQGTILFMTIDDDDVIFDMDYETFNSTVLDIAFDSNSEGSFIAAYKTFLENRTDEGSHDVYEESPVQEQPDPEYEVIAEEGEWQCIQIFNYSAALYFAYEWGDPAKWCIAYDGTDYYFNIYAERGDLYVFIQQGHPDSKYWYCSGVPYVYDINDNTMNATKFFQNHFRNLFN